jgi:transcriptional regulator with XRE-family HTH domain
MGTRERPRDRGHRRTREQLDRIAADIRLARVGSGLSLRDVAAAAGIDHTFLWRFERRRQDLSSRDLSAVCEAVGLDLVIRAYLGGDAIRDAAHARLLARLRTRIHPSLRWSTEVPVARPGDLRAWDAVVRGPGWRIVVEAETAVRDVQALERKVALKVRDGGNPHLVLLVADTAGNRRAIAAATAAFADLPLRNRQLLKDLRRGTDPRSSGILIL